MEKNITTLEENVEKLNSKMEAIDFEHINKRIEALETKSPDDTPNHTSPVSNSQASHTAQGTEEIMARMKRVNNVIFFGVPEKTPDVTNQQVDEIIKNLCPQSKAVKIARIGRTNDSGKPRPVIVELPTVGDKWNLIKNGNKEINRKSSELQGISIRPDLTKQQQEEEYKLRVELRSRKAKGETDLMIKKGAIVSKNF